MSVREGHIRRGTTALESRALWWLIGGRVLVAWTLLGASALWSSASAQNGAAGQGWFAGALSIAAAVLTLTVFYAVILRFTSIALPRQASVQFFFDVLLVTWLVWATGDLHSPYAALYIVVISATSIFLGARGALVTAVGCGVCYTATMLSLALGFVDGHGLEAASVPMGDAVRAIGLTDIGFFFVGLLAARLAELQARSDVQLTEAAHALANLRALHERIVESIRSGVVTTDLERRIYTVNAAAEEMTGYAAEDLRGQDVSILFGDIGVQIEDSMRAAREGHASPRYEAECLTSEGFRVRLGYSISPLFSERDETTGLVITFQDLTDVRAMEETSRRQERLSAVGRVAAGIAHEIRNPLAAMRGSIQVLRSEMSPDSAQAELMEIVLRESDRLNRIITDFLTYARPRTVSLADTDLREPLSETFALLRHSPEIGDGQTLEEVLPEEPVYAQADAEGIKQVFWNLARNALKAMPEGGRLRAELQNADDRRVRITFTDTGRGMSPAQVERLFEPFSSSTTGGTGLGLSIVYQIVRDHGGTINVRSREGHGTTITVELPAASQRPELARDISAR
ncbi:MAG TPA: ATP-binding protein [Pyrinomonadaceae bacterium]|jgi:two-component system sensor histidine kinase PilS (NtrC family)|nr:ATP-binding protein [Pyrinomonadaceae bacterium]